jgi:hypothetical protein
MVNQIYVVIVCIKFWALKDNEGRRTASSGNRQLVKCWLNMCPEKEPAELM